MNCIHPYVLKTEGYEGIEVPCRNCIACKVNRSTQWAMRIYHELTSWQYGVFLTLTYDENNIPDNYSLVKSDLQKFFKRLRHHIGKERKIKYFACGEYGEKRGRPHYHAIILGIDKNEHKLTKSSGQGWYVEEGPLKDAWQMGIIHIGEITNDSIGYVTHYIDKKLTGKLAEENYKNTKRIAPFQIQSQGFGLQYALKHAEQIKANLHLRYKGVVTPIPSYYREKLNIKEDERFKQLAIESQKKKIKEFLKRVNSTKDAEEVYNEIQQFRRFEKLGIVGLRSFMDYYNQMHQINTEKQKSRKQFNTNLNALYERGKENNNRIY